MKPETVMRPVGTACVVMLLSQPIWAPQWGTGLLGETAGQPLWASVAVVAGFLGLVALYCHTLQRTLTLVRPAARRAGPRSVWWMFAVPLNFVEDFYIVRAVAASLAADHLPTRAVRRWAVLGHAWCGLQIVSLFPGAVGLTAGAGALLLWAAHWILTGRLNRALAARRDRTDAGPAGTPAGPAAGPTFGRRRVA